MGPLWIVIPTRDRPEALHRQLARVVEEARRLSASSYGNSRAGTSGRRVKIVVSDDGSEPPARIPVEVVRRPGLAGGGNGVTLVRSRTSRGPNAARHLAIARSPRDAVIVEIDDHDIIEPGALAEIDRAFRAGACVAFGDFLRVDSRGEPAPVDPVVRKGEYRPWRFRDVRDGGALHVGLRAYRRELYDEVGGYRADEFPAGDYALMLRMEARLPGRGIVAIPKVLCSVVTSARGISVRLAREQGDAARRYLARIPGFRRPTPGDGRPPAGGEPAAPDFSRVTERYVWRGRTGNRTLLLMRAEELRRRERPPVSAVVPLFRSERHVEQCLRSLRDNLPAGSEIVAVDDASPDRSAEVARGVLRDDSLALVVRLSRNTGYAHATNIGARLARGRHLLLFNADAFAQRPGFAEPMLRALEEDPDAGVVGNRHVTPGGRVDSEGSEFSWRARTFQHVGRDIPDPLHVLPATSGDGVAPRETDTTCARGGTGASRPAQAHHRTTPAGLIQRDMVTFACALVRRECWDELGGLDERYRRAYYEDSDFCMRARLRGWRVLYVPGREAEILHHGRHSGAGSGRDYDANRRLFERRWVDTGMVDRFARERGRRMHERRVVVCMIACSEEEFVAPAIESVYPLADRIVIVEGGNRFAVRAGLCDELGRSTDRTVEEIESVADPDGKIQLVRAPGRPWRDKSEMRERYVAELAPGDWMLLLDADEVFTDYGLWRMSALMHGADVVCPAFHLFWNTQTNPPPRRQGRQENPPALGSWRLGGKSVLSTLGTGRWDEFRQIKAVKWRRGLTYLRNHNLPTDPRGVAVTAIRGVRVARPPQGERLYCHYSWAGKTDEKLRAKCAYYVAQNGAKVFPPDYFDRVFAAWRGADEAGRREIERRHGTHPYGGGGTMRFEGGHPGPVERRMREGRIGNPAPAKEGARP